MLKTKLNRTSLFWTKLELLSFKVNQFEQNRMLAFPPALFKISLQITILFRRWPNIDVFHKSMQVSFLCKCTARDNCLISSCAKPRALHRATLSSSLHCPGSPFFFPHDLVFNMDAAVAPHTTVYVAQKTPSLAFRRLNAARIELPWLNVAKYRRWNVSCVRRRCVFKAQSPRQYENWRGMASVWGPGPWVRSRYGWRDDGVGK